MYNINQLPKRLGMKTMSMLTYSQFQLCFNLTKPLNKEIKRSNISEMSFHLVSVPCLHEVKITKKTMCSIKCDQSPLVISKTYLALYCTRALFEFLCAKSLLQSADSSFANLPASTAACSGILHIFISIDNLDITV